MNPSFDHGKSASIRDSLGVSTGSNPAPLPAGEIESLLRMAQRNLSAMATSDPIEDLGPGDVQHFRGTSNSSANTPIPSVNQPAPTADVDASLQETERRLIEAILETNRPAHEASVTTAPATPAPVQSAEHSGLTLDDLGNVELDISIELGRTEILIEDIMKLREGSVVSLDRTAGDPVDIVANGKLVARGELLVIEGKFGVRLSEVL